MTTATVVDMTPIHWHTIDQAREFCGLATLTQLARQDETLIADLAEIRPPKGMVFNAGELIEDEMEDLRR